MSSFSTRINGHPAYLRAVRAIRHIRVLYNEMGILSYPTSNLMHVSIDEAIRMLNRALEEDIPLFLVLSKLHELGEMRRAFEEMVSWDAPVTVAQACNDDLL